MLQFAGGIALGMDIADFLEFKRAFQSQRIHVATAEIDDVARLGQLVRHPYDIRIHAKGLADQARRFEQDLHQVCLFMRRDAAALTGGSQGQAQQGGQLRGERLGRGDTDFRAGMGREHQIGFARHGRGMDIDQGSRLQAFVLAPAQRRQGVGGFARLRDRDRQRTRRHGRTAITEFRGNFDVDRQSGQLFKGVAGDRTGIICCATGNNLYADDIAEIDSRLNIRLNFAGHRIQIGRQGALAAVGLLVHFLFHEVTIGTLLYQGCRSRDSGD